jgi:hypothetical protein
MPTKRTKRSRNRRGVPAQLEPVFAIGMGWNFCGHAWLAARWREYGRAFLDAHQDTDSSSPFRRTPFALKVLGTPEDGEPGGVISSRRAATAQEVQEWTTRNQ